MGWVKEHLVIFYMSTTSMTAPLPHGDHLSQREHLLDKIILQNHSFFLGGGSTFSPFHASKCNKEYTKAMKGLFQLPPPVHTCPGVDVLPRPEIFATGRPLIPDLQLPLLVKQWYPFI